MVKKIKNNENQRTLFDPDFVRGDEDIKEQDLKNKINEMIRENIKQIQDELDLKIELLDTIIKENKETGTLLERELTKHIAVKENSIEYNSRKNIVIHPNSNYKITNKLKELMAKNGIDSQIRLAERLNISSKTLSNIISNKFNTSLEVALKLSYILNVTVNEIFELQYDCENDFPL